MARTWAWSYVELLRDGRSIQESRVLRLAPAVRDYLAYRERSVQPRTYENDRYATDVLVGALGPDYAVHDIGADDVQRVLDARLDAGYAGSTVRTIRAYLSIFFGWVGADPNPAKATELPKLRRRGIFTWSDDELVRLREAADRVDHGLPQARARLLLEAGLATGARYRELLALRWEDFDAATRTVRISRQLAQYGTGLTPPKGGGARTAVVLPFWWAYHQSGARGPMFDRDRSSKAAERTLKRVLGEAELDGPQRAFHDLRRTYGRLFLEAGGWMDELQRSLGHSSIRTTESDYGEFHEAVAAQFAVDRMYGEGRQRRLRVVE